MATEPYRDSIHINADPALVFDYFVNPDALARWMGDSAILDPRPGGRFTVFFADRYVEGRYIDVDPPRRVVISWGRGGSATFPPGSSTLEVTFTPEAGGTRVEITHSGLPGDEAQKHALGWQHYLARLAAAAAGRRSGPARHPGRATPNPN